MTIRKAYAPDLLRLDFKAMEEGPGGFTGYGAVYGNVDRDDEIIRAGAFGGSLDAFVRDGFIGIGHDWKSGVATIVDASEDEYGLRLSAQFHSDPEAQTHRQRVAERIARGKSVGLSVGFRVQTWEWDEQNQRRIITAGELFEVSLVTVPANPLASVSSVKGFAPDALPGTVREFERFLREAGFSKSQAVAIASQGFKALQLDNTGRRESDSTDNDDATLVGAYLLEQARSLGVAV